MSPKIRYTILLVFLAIVKHTTSVKVYVLEDALTESPVNGETSIYLKHDTKNRVNSKNHSICNKRWIICLTTDLQEVKDVLRGGEDVTIKKYRSSSSEEHYDSHSSENNPANFDDFTRGSHKRVKSLRRFIRLKPVLIEDTNKDLSKLIEERNHVRGSGRRLSKIVRKHPKIIDPDDKQKINSNKDIEESESDEAEDDEETNDIKVPSAHKEVEEDGEEEEKSSESLETEKSGDDNDASPETEEQVKNIKKKPLKAYKQFIKPDHLIEKRKKSIKKNKKHRIPKRFEVVDNGNEEESEKRINRGDESDDSEENSNESSINPAPDPNLDLTVLEEKNSIEKPTEKHDLVDMTDNKEKYTYIQGLDRSLHVGKKKESSEEAPLAEDDKTTEEDAALLYRKSYGRLPQFLPKRYLWSDEDYRNLGYFWFNGPQGRGPGNYRIKYK